MPIILIIDSSKQSNTYIKEILDIQGYSSLSAQNTEDAKMILDKKQIQAIIYHSKDILQTTEFIATFNEAYPLTSIIIWSEITDHVFMIDCMKLGAVDFLVKPIDMNRLLQSIKLATNKKTNNANPFSDNDFLHPILGKSDAIVQVKKMIDLVAPTNARVLITGQNGVGKELVAQWIHHKSKRQKGPLIELNCAAIPIELIESELFGYEKGSFTSALKQHIGKFEQAHGGTLFLDEIGDMSLLAQAKVLRVLQENKITRIGANASVNIDVRVIAATNKDLLNEVSFKKFRLDLYHRLSVVVIHVPALQERREDIPELVRFFINKISSDYKIVSKTITPEAMEVLKNHRWTGNVRELYNVVERLMVFCDKIITLQDINQYVVPQRGTLLF